MENQKIKFPIAAVLYAISALLSGISVISSIAMGYPFGSILKMLLVIGAFLVLAVVLFMKRRDIILVAALALPAVAGLVQLNLWMVLMYVILAALAATTVIPQLDQFRELAKKLWFVPGAISALSAVISTIRSLSMGIPFGVLIPSLIGTLIGVAMVLLLGKWIVDPYDRIAYGAEEGFGYEGGAAATGSGYISMATHVLLMLFLGGIWLYVWIYKTTRYLNCAPDSEYRNPTTKLLLCMFVPFYYLYWVHQSSKRIDSISNAQGIPSDSAATNLILAIFIGIVPPILMQSKINSLCANQ